MWAGWDWNMMSLVCTWQSGGGCGSFAWVLLHCCNILTPEESCSKIRTVTRFDCMNDHTIL